MRGGDRTDILMAAVTVSLVVHVALMFFIAPRVMSRTVGEQISSRHREAMRVTERPPSKEMLKLELLKDVPPVRDAPVAEIDDLGMAAAFVAIPEAADGAPVHEPETIVDEPALQSVAEQAPVFAAKVDVIERRETVSPIVEETEFAAPPAAGDSPSVDFGLSGEMFVPAPSVAPSAVETPVPPTEVSRIEGDVAKPKKVFETTDRIFETVDSAVVEAEKAAVRALVDSSDARDLGPEMNFSLKTRSVGAWTYFGLDFMPKDGELAIAPKDVVILLDASGSIGDDRLVSCRKAARRLLRSALNTDDRFNLVAFRDRFSYAFRSWQSCTAASYDAADKWLADLAPHGRTDVFATISSVLTLPRDPKRPIVAVVVTDGDANVGVSETAKIISGFSSLNDGLVSVYMYGVRKSANVELIDVLTRGNRGESVVHEGSRWKAGEGLEGLSERFRDPVLTDLRLVFSATCPARVYPRSLKNLYLGNSVSLVGRVPTGTRELAFSLRGQNAGRAYESFVRLPIASGATDYALPARFAAEQAIDARLK